jgi:hypothetical protein
MRLDLPLVQHARFKRWLRQQHVAELTTLAHWIFLTPRQRLACANKKAPYTSNGNGTFYYLLDSW